MKLVFYSLVLNNHQANVADELWEQTGHDYYFVELANVSGVHKKGDTRDYSKCPYLLQAWKCKEEYDFAMELARTADVCVFSGVQALPFQRERIRLGLLSFDMSERWLKRGFFNIFSPHILKMLIAYHFGRWQNKPLYKLCCSAFTADDQYRLHTFEGRCYKWGYFTKVSSTVSRKNNVNAEIVRLMWCSRYMVLKHPEIPVYMASRLKSEGYRFVLDMYGEGDIKEVTMHLAEELGVKDVVNFKGGLPNEALLDAMAEYDIFLFTSDRNEGWGAVVNESMANGCVVVAGDSIGSVPYLIKDGETGLVFQSPSTASGFNGKAFLVDDVSLDSICAKVEWLIANKEEMQRISENAVRNMRELWSPQIAAARFLGLIDSIRSGSDTPFLDGPCSKALPLR